MSLCAELVSSACTRGKEPCFRDNGIWMQAALVTAVQLMGCFSFPHDRRRLRFGGQWQWHPEHLQELQGCSYLERQGSSSHSAQNCYSLARGKYFWIFKPHHTFPRPREDQMRQVRGHAQGKPVAQLCRRVTFVYFEKWAAGRCKSKIWSIRMQVLRLECQHSEHTCPGNAQSTWSCTFTPGRTNLLLLQPCTFQREPAVSKRVWAQRRQRYGIETVKNHEVWVIPQMPMIGSSCQV